jgi:plastocyanin
VLQAGESVSWVNNAGFPHNIVFDEDESPVSSSREGIAAQQIVPSVGPAWI